MGDVQPPAHSTPSVRTRRPRWVTGFIVVAIVVIALVVVAHLTGVMGAGMH
jgi:hypothetical protein